MALRNSKLSAYYSAAAGSTATASPPAPTGNAGAIADDLPTTGGREAAIEYATALTKSLPLPTLMSRSAALRTDADVSSMSLHTSSREYYTHLASSSRAAQTAMTVATELTAPSTSTISSLISATTSCTTMADRLCKTRKEVDALDGVQRLTHLLRASNILIDTLVPLFHAATDLCTDAENARRHLGNAARRAAAIAPSVTALGEHSAQFAECGERLRESMRQTRKLVHRRFFPSVGRMIGDGSEHEEEKEGGGGGGGGGTGQEGGEEEVQALTLRDAASLSLLLDTEDGADRMEVARGYLEMCGRRLLKRRGTEMAVRAARSDGGAWGEAVMHVQYAKMELVGKVQEGVEGLQEVFGDFEESGLCDEWVAGIGEEGVVMRVREAFAKGGWEEWGTRGCEELKEGLLSLGDGCDGVVGAVLRVVGEQGWKEVEEMVWNEAARVVKEAVKRVARDDGEGGGEELWRSVSDMVSRASRLDGVVSEERLVREVVVDGLVSAGQEGLREGAVVGKVLREMGTAQDGELGEWVGRVGEIVLDAVEKRVVEDVVQLLRHRLQRVCEGTRESDEDVDKATRLLREMQEVGVQCGVAALRRVSGEDDVQLAEEDGRVGRAVASGWRRVVRDSWLSQRWMVDIVGEDAQKVGAALGVGCLTEVRLAAEERCPAADAEAAAP